MDETILAFLLADGLWLFIAVGWILLITLGLEVDKPLSGGIPGHVSADEEQADKIREGFWGRLGEVGASITFASVSLSLPLILYWIWVVHPH